MTEEEVKPMAPGLIQAYAPEEPEEKVEGSPSVLVLTIHFLFKTSRQHLLLTSSL